MPKGSILVVDDEAEIREGLELLLRSEGYAVTSAETAAAGLTRLEERPFDLVLLDVSLPDRSIYCRKFTGAIRYWPSC
jgi:two-component system, NtrC family, nitrogen regulation response regulator NtrX